MSTYIHDNTNPVNPCFTSEAKDMTFDAKTKGMTSCRGGASSPRPRPGELHLCQIPLWLQVISDKTLKLLTDLH